MSNSRIDLVREELFGGKFTSNVLNLKVSGIELLPKGYRCVSLDANDPNLAALSLAATAIKNRLNAAFDSPDIVAKIEFTRSANPDGTEDQILSVKLNPQATVSDKKSTIVIQNRDGIRFVAGQVATALSDGRAVSAANDGSFANFDKSTKVTGFNPKAIKASKSMLVREYEPTSETSEEERAAYEGVKTNMDSIVDEHGSAMFILSAKSEDKKGGFFGKAHKLFTFFALGASSCGSCRGQDKTHGKSGKEANSALETKFSGAVKAQLKSIPHQRGSFVILKSGTPAPV